MTKKKDVMPTEIPADGNLGLLAIGYRGIMAWREARKNAGIDLIALKRKEHEEWKVRIEGKKAAFEQKKKEKLEERKNKNKQ